MPEPVTPEAKTPDVPAPVPPPENAKDGAFDLQQWRNSLDDRHMPAFEEYAGIKAKPLQTELQGLRTEVGRLKRTADPAMVAMLGEHDAFLDELKQAAVTLLGLPEEEVKDAATVRELRFAARGRIARLKDASAIPADPAAKADPATQEAWKEFQAARQTATTKGAANTRLGPEAMAGGRGGPSNPTRAALAKVDTRRMTQAELKEHEKKLNAAPPWSG